MKRLFFLLMTCLCIINAHAAYLRNIPVTVNQPDGTVLQCFASGDEYFNYLHDKDGYTIIQHPQTGYYVYAEVRDGSLAATEFVAGQHDPASKGLQPYALISPEEWMARRRAWIEPAQRPQNRPQNRDIIPNHGTLNNISIFIRFSDDDQFSNSYYDIYNMFNNVSEGAISLRSYFRAASYGAIEIPTTFYPGHNGSTIISYKDTYPRSYFEPYNASTNPNGYTESERAEREFSLLERAVNYINSYYPIPSGLNIDYNEDGDVDNVCFIVKGGVGAWSSLLWPHKWNIYDRTVNINGKRVWTFNFQLADATGYFNTSTMCHEMNHSLGAPDLYHYYIGEELSPVGTWDLMEYNTTPPQHCGAYMKMKYGHWIDYIPTITKSGTYTLNPIGSSTPTNVAYRIPTSDPNQFYVVEYRKKSMPFESGVPGSGLLVYRINTSFSGNASYDPEEGIYDEVYIFRPDGTVDTNGDLYQAHFSAGDGRREFSSSTNPAPFFTDGTPDPDFRIYNITSAGNTISFTYDCPDGQEEDCVYIGDGGTDASELFPTYSWYKYVLTQQIYTAQEIGTAGTIHSIAFYNDGTTHTRDCDFYLVATDKTMFESNSDWVPVTQTNKVFSGTVTMTTGEWTTITFDTPFAYDGISNLVLVTDDNTGSYSEPNMTCRVFPGYYQSIIACNDNTDYDPRTPQNYSGSRRSYKNQIKMQITTPTGEAVVIGEEGTTASVALPSHSYYNYALTQQIYTADEIGGTGIINSIGFYNIGAAKTRIYDFYLVATDKTSFADATDWVAVTDADKVFSGIVTMTAGNWTTIAFDKPFVYDGTSNLLLVADDNTGSYTTMPHMSCSTFEASSQALRIFGDDTNYDPATPDFTGVKMDVKNQIRLHVVGHSELYVINQGGTDASVFLPSHSYFKYALTQQIYTAEEIGHAGVISRIGFYNEGVTKTRNYDFYLVSTNKNSFSDGTDWVAVADDKKVFSGIVTMTAGEWTMIELDRPFVYDGISNLILIADDNSGDWTNSPYMRCRVFNGPSQSIRVCSDGMDYDPEDPENYEGTVLDVKNQIIMQIESADELYVIGDGGTTTNSYLPSYSYWKYSFTQQIYTVEEIGAAGIISSIAFYNAGETKTRTYDFYLVATDKTVFADNTDWVTVTDDNKVFSGSVTMKAGEWNMIEFYKPFVYDGVSNLVLVADDNTGSYTNAPHMRCLAYNAPSQAIRIYNDNVNFDPMASEDYEGTILNLKNQIVMHIERADEMFYVGDGGINSLDYLPSYTYYNYSYSQQIYTAGEICSAGTIHSIAFYNGGAKRTRNFDFYLVATDRTAFDDGYGWETVTDADKVFSGEVTMNAGEWTMIKFDTPFEYDGFSNLVLVTDDNTGSWNYSPQMSCRVLDAPSQSMYIYNDNINYNIGETANYSGTIQTVKNEVLFGIIPSPVQQTITLSQGWNWISTYIAIENPEDAMQMLQNALGENGLKILSSEDYTMYEDGAWGAMGDLEELENEQTYMILTSVACTVELHGLLANPSKYTITIKPGWNWIGFPSGLVISVEDAFAGFEAEEGDKIITEDDYTIYEDGAWGAMGDLEELIPGQGLKYYSASTETKTLIFRAIAK